MIDTKNLEGKSYNWDKWPELLRIILEDEYGVDFILNLFLNKFDNLKIRDKTDLHHDIAYSSFYAGLRMGYSLAFNIALPLQKFKEEAEEITENEFQFLRENIQSWNNAKPTF